MFKKDRYGDNGKSYFWGLRKIDLPEDFEFIYQLCVFFFQYVFLTDTVCTNKCNMNNAVFKEVTQHEKRNLRQRNGGVKLA